MSYSITQFGKPLDLSKYTICEKTKTFSSKENNLVLDFNGLYGWSFKTGYSCILNTEWWCTFNTGSFVLLKLGSSCTFDTGSSCTFKTRSSCTFKTGSSCTFETGKKCTFDTGSKCVIVRRDIFEVIEIPENTKIQLNEHKVKGYKVIPETHKIIIDNKEIELSKESFEELKKSLLD